MIFYVSSGLVGGSSCSRVYWEWTLGILITAIASYTLIGGFLAVSRTDVFQAMLMLVSFVIITTTLTG